jgi:hypothetical protein
MPQGHILRTPGKLEFWRRRPDVVGMDFVTVYTALNPADADLVRSRLEANDFLVNIKNEIAARTIEGYALAAGGLHVQVPEDQAQSARQLIESKDP